MHVAVFFQLFNSPDEGARARHYALMQAWAKRHRVTLITTTPTLTRRAERFPRVPEGVRLVELPLHYRNHMGTPERMPTYARYAAWALWKGLSALERPDVVLGVSNPLSVPAVAALVAHLRGVPFVFDVKDLWPDFPVQMGAVPLAAARRALYRLERTLYRRAAHVVTVSPDMTAHVVAAGTLPDKVTTLFNGTDPAFVEASRTADLDALRRAHDLEGRRVVLYAGAFGRANNAPLLVRVAEALAARDDGAVLVCLGEGYDEPMLRAAAARLPTLRVPGPVARPDVFAWFRLAELSIVSFRPLPVLGTTSPAKFYDSVACGTPPVVVCDGWLRRFVAREGCGFFADASDPQACAAAIAALLDDPARLREVGARAEAVYRADVNGMFDRTRHADVYEDIFLRVRGAVRQAPHAAMRPATLDPQRPVLP